MSRALNMAKLCAEGHLFVDDRVASVGELLDASTGAVWQQKTTRPSGLRGSGVPFFFSSFLLSHVSLSTHPNTRKKKQPL